MSKFAALIIGIIAGILCFLGIMYYFKWRRETGGANFSFSNLFGNRNNPPHVNANPPQYPAGNQSPSYGTGYPNQGAPGYYSNPNYPNYPPL